MFFSGFLMSKNSSLKVPGGDALQYIFICQVSSDTFICFGLVWCLTIVLFRFFYASSACIYPEFKQLETNVSLKESDAWPAEVCFLKILCFLTLPLSNSKITVLNLSLVWSLAPRCLRLGEACDRRVVQALQQRFWNWMSYWKVP